MDPKHFSSFLDKYKKLPTPKRHIKTLVETFLRIENSIGDVSLRNGVLYVKASPGVKQEILLKKKKLLSFLKEQSLGVMIEDVR